jgi:hypothetical protein
MERSVGDIIGRTRWFGAEQRTNEGISTVVREMRCTDDRPPCQLQKKSTCTWIRKKQKAEKSFRPNSTHPAWYPMQRPEDWLDPICLRLFDRRC